MINGARSQAGDVRTDILVGVPHFSLRGSCVSVAGRCSVFKVHGRG